MWLAKETMCAFKAFSKCNWFQHKLLNLYEAHNNVLSQTHVYNVLALNSIEIDQIVEHFPDSTPVT